MDNLHGMERNLPAPELPGTSNARRGKPRQGKGSRTRNQQKFRDRTNAQEAGRIIDSIASKHKLFETDDTKQLETIANTVQVTAQKRAIPLSLTTRAVGFSTAIFYDRAASTWSMQAIAEIATIHQIYRVHLWLVHYKVFLAQQMQVEPVTVDGAIRRIFINDEIREILQTVSEVSSLISLILDSVGKIETTDGIYHMGYAIQPTETAETLDYSIVCVNSNNIRAIVMELANPDTPLANRMRYFQYNSIADVRVVGNLLMNADQIYPNNYDAATLRQDVHAYKNLLTKIQPRLPKHSILTTRWSGKAAASGLWSGTLTETKLTSMFSEGDAVQRSVRRRDARGQQIQPVVVEAQPHIRLVLQAQ